VRIWQARSAQNGACKGFVSLCSANVNDASDCAPLPCPRIAVTGDHGVALQIGLPMARRQ
jgi:hypothetical protein